MFRDAVDAAHRRDAHRCAEVLSEATDEPSDFRKVFVYGFFTLRHVLEPALGSTPTSDQVATLVATADTDFLRPVEEEYGDGLVLRAVRAAFELEPPPTDPVLAPAFALAVVAALVSLLKFPLADITNRRAEVAVDVRDLGARQQVHQDLLK